MVRRRFIIRHGGHWERSEYVDDDKQLVLLLIDELDFDSLQMEIYDIMQTNPSLVQYLLYYMTSTNDGRRIKVSLRNDSDLFELLWKQTREVVIFVTERIHSSSRPSRVQPSINPSTTTNFIPNHDPIRDDDSRHETPPTDNEAKENDECNGFRNEVHVFQWSLGTCRTRPWDQSHRL